MPSATTARPSGPTGQACSRQSRTISGTRCLTTTRTPGRPCPSSSPRRTARSPMSPTMACHSAFRPRRSRSPKRTKPANFDDIPDGLKDSEGHWFTIHYGTLGLFVNVDALGGAAVPASWADLLKPEYEGKVGYLDPSSAFVGYAARGGGESRHGRLAGRLLAGHRLLQEAEGERAHRAQADLVRAGALGRDPDPVRLRLQRLPRQVQG